MTTCHWPAVPTAPSRELSQPVGNGAAVPVVEPDVRLIGAVVDRVGRGAQMAVADRGPGALVSVGAVALPEGDLFPTAVPKGL